MYLVHQFCAYIYTQFLYTAYMCSQRSKLPSHLLGYWCSGGNDLEVQCKIKQVSTENGL